MRFACLPECVRLFFVTLHVSKVSWVPSKLLSKVKRTDSSPATPCSSVTPQKRGDTCNPVGHTVVLFPYCCHPRSCPPLTKQTLRCARNVQIARFLQYAMLDSTRYQVRFYSPTLLSSRKTDSTQQSYRCCCHSVPETTQQGAHRMRCRRAPKPRHVRPMFPVFAGMSGRNRTTLIAVFNAPMCSVLCSSAFGNSSHPFALLATFHCAAAVLGVSAVRGVLLSRCSSASWAFLSF